MSFIYCGGVCCEWRVVRKIVVLFVWSRFWGLLGIGGELLIIIGGLDGR